MITKEALEKLYVTDRWTKQQVADHFGVSCSTISNYLRKFGIEKGCAVLATVFTKELLEDLYLGQNLTQDQIAERYDVTRRTIGNYLVKFGLLKEHAAVLESTRSTMKARYGVTHLMKDKAHNAAAGKKRVATMKGEGWGRERINEILRDRQLKMVGEYTTLKTKTLFRCLKKGCGCEWSPTPFDILEGHGCPRCVQKERYTPESFEAFLNEHYPDVECTGQFKNVTTPVSFHCRICGYGEDETWIKKPCDFTCVRKQWQHICPRCNGQERYTREQFIAKLAEVNPNIRLVGEYNGQNHSIKLKCLLDGYQWEIKRPYEVIKKDSRRTGCPACQGFYMNGIVYDSSWEVLFHFANPHLERNIHRSLPYDCNGTPRKWYPDFYDPATGQFYEIKPEVEWVDKYGRTAAKLAAGLDVIWIRDEEIKALQDKYPHFDPQTFCRRTPNPSS